MSALPLLVLLALAASPVTWARPVGGEVTRPFVMHGSPFAAGQHRGVDLAAPAGTVVGAPCGGRVVVAARIGSSRGVVTVGCGPWRASVLPLARILVRRGESVEAGEPVGAAGATPGHSGLHVGIRRASERFGYVDPLRFLPHDHAPPLGPAPPPAGVVRREVPPRAEPATPRASSPASPAAHRDSSLPPWPAWAGAALLLAAVGRGVVAARGRVVASIAARTRFRRRTASRLRSRGAG